MEEEIDYSKFFILYREYVRTELENNNSDFILNFTEWRMKMTEFQQTVMK